MKRDHHGMVALLPPPGLRDNVTVNWMIQVAPADSESRDS